MDRHIDLTRDRDFRQRRVDPSVPRSIFKKENAQIAHITFSSNNSIMTGTGTWMYTTTGTDFTSMNSTYNTTYQYTEGQCSQCGKEISRVPWNHSMVCKECTTMATRMFKRIPWRR